MWAGGWRWAWREISQLARHFSLSLSRGLYSQIIHTRDSICNIKRARNNKSSSCRRKGIKILNFCCHLQGQRISLKCLVVGLKNQKTESICLPLSYTCADHLYIYFNIYIVYDYMHSRLHKSEYWICERKISFIHGPHMIDKEDGGLINFLPNCRAIWILIVRWRQQVHLTDDKTKDQMQMVRAVKWMKMNGGLNGKGSELQKYMCTKRKFIHSFDVLYNV